MRQGDALTKSGNKTNNDMQEKWKVSRWGQDTL